MKQLLTDLNYSQQITLRSRSHYSSTTLLYLSIDIMCTPNPKQYIKKK